MHRLGAIVLCAWLALLAPPPAAGAAFAVESMNYPAWLLRNYQTLPLAAGAQLQPNDLVRTGPGGRVRIALAAGAVIDLGESSRLVIESGAAGSTAATLQLLRGVFRIDAAPRAGADFALGIRVGALSLSARDAEFWGRSDARQDLACLLRGQLRVQDSDGGATGLERALSCYVKPRQREALPVDVVALEQHRLWVAETGPDAAAGIAADGGQWQLVLASFEDPGGAERELVRLRELGYAVRRKTVLRSGRSLHRLLLPGFVSIDAAQKAGARIERELGIAGAWVWRAN